MRIGDLFKRTKKQGLPHAVDRFANPLDVLNMTMDEELILMTGKVRGVETIPVLMEKYQAGDAVELIQKLPGLKPVDWRRRLRNWIVRLEGGYESDPHAKEFQELKRQRTRRPR